MKELSNAEIALLGLLSEQPMHPYMIERQVQHRDMRFWTDLSMSSIYKLLRKMEEDGLLNRENQISEANQLQKIYSLSQTGRKALQEAIEKKLSVPEHVRWPIDIGLYNSSLLPKKKVCAALRTYRTELEAKIKGYKDLREYLVQSGCPAHRYQIAVRPIFLLKAEIKWIDTYLEELQSTKS